MADPNRLAGLFGDRPLVAVDTETTGLWAPINRVVEIGAVKFRLGQDTTETFQSLIDPGRPIPPRVTEIHGITDDMVAGAPMAEEILPAFLDFIEGSILFAHNAPFDISFIGCELDRCQLANPANPTFDTVDIIAKLYPGWPSYSLLSLVQAFRVSATQAHRALADALQVKALVNQAAVRLLDYPDPRKVIATFNLHSLADWKGREIDLPAEFTDITVAISQGRKLEIVYTSENAPPQRRIIHPKHVHARRSLFYVVAYCELAKDERTFRLDRIQSFQLLTD